MTYGTTNKWQKYRFTKWYRDIQTIRTLSIIINKGKIFEPYLFFLSLPPSFIHMYKKIPSGLKSRYEKQCISI